MGAASIQKAQLLNPGVSVGGIPISYPPPFFMPKIGCDDQMAEVSEDGTTMSPGSWDEDFPPEGVTFLKPGVYCLNKGMSINSSLEGHDVVFRVESGDVHFDGNAKIDLDAPDEGETSGLLIYLPLDNNSKVTLNGGADSQITGTILAPASTIVIKGNSSPAGFHSQIIGYRIDVDGSSKVVIVYDDAQNFNAVTMPEIQLTE